MGDARVRINAAAADELNESLSDVEPEQARLIVAYREEHGFLRGPEDLERVEGIDRETVAALAPYIDWSVPPEREGAQQRSWGWALVAAVTFLAFLWQLAFRSLPALVQAAQEFNPLALWYAAADAGFQAGMALGMSALAAFSLTEDQRRARKAVLVGVAGLILALLAYVFAALATASRYLFLDPGGWTELRRNPQELLNVPTGAAITLVALPVVLVLWRPALAASSRLARLFDVGLALAALGLTLVVWAFGGALPLWYSVLTVLWGLFFGYVALRALRSGESAFFPLARYLTPRAGYRRPAGRRRRGVGDVDQLPAAGRGGPEGAEALPGREIPGLAEPERPLRRDRGREPLAGGARAEWGRRVARREGSGAGVRPVGPGGGRDVRVRVVILVHRRTDSEVPSACAPPAGRARRR